MIKLKTKNYNISALSFGKIDKYEYFTVDGMLPSDQSKIKEQAKFTYFPLGKVFEKQMKRIEDQWKKQIKTLKEHGKQLDKYSDEKESLTYSKQKFFFEELANRRMEKIKYLSKQTDFNNLTYRHKGNRSTRLL